MVEPQLEVANAKTQGKETLYVDQETTQVMDEVVERAVDMGQG
jgi:hypothetical protein